MLAGWRRDTDPPGAEADAQRAFARRAVHVSALWSGMVHFDGDLDPEGGSVVLTALRSLSEGAALDPGDNRTPAQCRADALVEICRRHLDGGPPPGSRRPHLTLTVPWPILKDGAGVVDLEGGPVGAEAVLRLACDASVSVVTLSDGIPPAPPARSAGWSPRRCGGPWTCATAGAPTRAATSRRAGATPTTSSTGLRAGRPKPPTCGCFVEGITGRRTTTSHTRGGRELTPGRWVMYGRLCCEPGVPGPRPP